MAVYGVNFILFRADSLAARVPFVRDSAQNRAVVSTLMAWGW